MICESRGQISIEMVLLIGLTLIIVIAAAQFIGPSIEQDKVMSAAKIGFIDASNDISYSNSNVIRFNNMTFNNGVITINAFSKSSIANNITYIQNKTLSKIAQVLNTDVNNNTVQGRYTYKVVISTT